MNTRDNKHDSTEINFEIDCSHALFKTIKEYGEKIINNSLTEKEKTELLKQTPNVLKNLFLYMSFFLPDDLLSILYRISNVKFDKTMQQQLMGVKSKVQDFDPSLTRYKFQNILSFLSEAYFALNNNYFKNLVNTYLESLISSKSTDEFSNVMSRARSDYIFANNEGYINQKELYGCSLEGKWVIRTPKGSSELGGYWSKILQGINSSRLYGAQVSPVSEQVDTQMLCVCTPNIKNIKEIKETYEYLTNDLQISKEVIVGYKTNYDTLSNGETYTSYEQVTNLYNNGIENINDYESKLKDILNQINIHQYELHWGGGIEINGKKYSHTAAKIKNLIEAALPPKNNQPITASKFYRLAETIEIELMGKTKTTTTQGGFSFIRNLGKRDETTVNLYNNILNVLGSVKCTNKDTNIEKAIVGLQKSHDQNLKDKIPHAEITINQHRKPLDHANESQYKQVKPTRKIDFNQLYKLHDIANFGNCYAYTVLFLTYVTIFQIKGERIDYSAFIKSLDSYDNKEKKAINDMQDLHPTNVGLLNHKLAMINENSNLCNSVAIREIGELINQARQNFYAPVFYFLGIDDEKQTIFLHPLSHEIGVYLPSPHELHVFDSNSGLYIFDLPQDINNVDMAEILIDIIFNKNKLFKLFCKPVSPSLKFQLDQSVLISTDRSGVKQYIKNVLQQFIDNPKLALQALPLKDATIYDESIRNFLHRHLFMLKQQHLQQPQQTSNQYSLTQSLLSFWQKPKEKQVVETGLIGRICKTGRF